MSRAPAFVKGSTMKIAIATIDDVTVSQHFGRSKSFIVFDIVDGAALNRETRANHHSPHAQGQCGHEAAHDHGSHSHNWILDLLGDCKVVIAAGMGPGASQALQANGIEAAMVSPRSSLIEVAEAFAKGTLATTAGSCEH
jgi:predicted Fe-Mo cluster-binding NifX family protein